MHVIWHDNKFIQLHVREMLRYFTPRFFRNLANFGKLHRRIFNTSEKMVAVFCANRDEIGTRCCIIVALQSSRFNAVFVAEEAHAVPFDSTFVIVFARLRARVSL